MLANQIARQKENLTEVVESLIDVCPIAVGIRKKDSKNCVLIARNTKLPFKTTKEFTNA